jgi:hypothetical protein
MTPQCTIPDTSIEYGLGAGTAAATEPKKKNPQIE